MARRRTLDRRAMRDENDAAERLKDEEDQLDEEEEEVDEEEEEEAEAELEEEGEEGEEEEERPKKAKKKKSAPAAPKRTRTPKQVRMRAVWVVYDNSSKALQTFPYPQRAEAEAFLQAKNAEKKGGCYLQMVKEPME
ncbi:MAG TPA: hypothetical protein VIL46_06895 [Gemmataceae bacterium]